MTEVCYECERPLPREPEPDQECDHCGWFRRPWEYDCPVCEVSRRPGPEVKLSAAEEWPVVEAALRVEWDKIRPRFEKATERGNYELRSEEREAVRAHGSAFRDLLLGLDEIRKHGAPKRYGHAGWWVFVTPPKGAPLSKRMLNQKGPSR